MAQSTYSSNTLMGNFQEEQASAPPLRGVLANYGANDYTTTSKAELTRPQKNRQYRPERHNSLHQLITVEYIEEMAIASATADRTAKFADVLARADASKAPDTSTHMETTAASAFGARPARKGRRAQEMSQTNQIAAAQAKAGEQKQAKQAGAYGEQLREDGSNPANDTRSQRSWVYGGAGMFEENRKAARELPRPKPEPTSLQIGGGPAVPEGGNFRRSTTDITKGAGSAINGKGKGVWSD
jgi:hypothetical protein